VVPLLVAQKRGVAVNLPGRALAAAVRVLHKDGLSEEESKVLEDFHAAVVEHLRAAGKGGEEGLQTLATAVRGLVK